MVPGKDPLSTACCQHKRKPLLLCIASHREDWINAACEQQALDFATHRWAVLHYRSETEKPSFAGSWRRPSSVYSAVLPPFWPHLHVSCCRYFITKQSAPCCSSNRKLLFTVVYILLRITHEWDKKLPCHMCWFLGHTHRLFSVSIELELRFLYIGITSLP